MVPRDNWKIDLKKTALITIDMQRAYLEPGAAVECAAGREFIPKINELASTCRKLGIPVIHMCNSFRADLTDVGLMQEIRPRTDSEWEAIEGRRGVEFYKDLNIDEDDYVVKKIRYSAFIPGSSTLGSLLWGLGRDSFIICGIATDICVMSTTIDGMMLGYRVFFVGDLCATLNEERQRAALRLLDSQFAKVITFEEVRNELKELATPAEVS